MYVYDIDHHHALVKEISLPPAVRFIRGVGADPISHALYIAYGSVSRERPTHENGFADKSRDLSQAHAGRNR